MRTREAEPPTRARAILWPGSFAAAALALVTAACAPAAPEAVQPAESAKPLASAGEAPASGQSIAFRWPEVRGKGEVSHVDLAGRISVLVFITAYDVLSQALVRFASQLARDHVPRLNVVAVMLEPPEHKLIAETYANTLDLKFPVVLADAATIRGEGPFAGLHHVPAIAILDREGRERFRHLGLMNHEGLEAAVVRVEKDTGVEKD